MTFTQLEEAIWERDTIRVVVRAPGWASVLAVPTQINAADRGMSITEFVKARVKPYIGEYDCIVIDGSGNVVHGRTKVERVRASYSGA